MMITLKQIYDNTDEHVRAAIEDSIRKIAYAGSESFPVESEAILGVLFTKRIPFRRATYDTNTLWYLQGKADAAYKCAIGSAVNQLAEAVYEHLENKGFTEKIGDAKHRIEILKSHLYKIDVFNEDLALAQHEAPLVSHLDSQLSIPVVN